MDSPLRFSQRLGFTPTEIPLQVDEFDARLRNRLWNLLYQSFWQHRYETYDEINDTPTARAGVINYILEEIWSEFFGERIDVLHDTGTVITRMGEVFQTGPWYAICDLIEYVFQSKGLRINQDKVLQVNQLLTQENAAYRLLGSMRFIPVTTPIELEAISAALSSPASGVRQHVARACELLGDRENPDYRNTIKEAISAVESAAKVVTGQEAATLGAALKILGKKHALHPVLEQAFSKLYGYTSDEGGIRHAMIDDPGITATDAKFMLVACSAFANFLLEQSVNS